MNTFKELTAGIGVVGPKLVKQLPKNDSFNTLLLSNKVTKAVLIPIIIFIPPSSNTPTSPPPNTKRKK